LITEHFAAGDTLFRKGSPADRIIYVVTGRVAIVTTDADGAERKLAEIGPGNFCGDVSQPGARHTETVRAVDDTMVRTLSVESWSAGVLGILDSDPVQRRVISTILRGEHVTPDALIAALEAIDPTEVQDAITQLTESGQLRIDEQGRLGIAARRRSLSGSSAILDRLDF
jgi:CRP-like cAMP-binding protein